jgi:hypothetical protein
MRMNLAGLLLQRDLIAAIGSRTGAPFGKQSSFAVDVPKWAKQVFAHLLIHLLFKSLARSTLLHLGSQILFFVSHTVAISLT